MFANPAASWYYSNSTVRNPRANIVAAWFATNTDVLPAIRRSSTHMEQCSIPRS